MDYKALLVTPRTNYETVSHKFLSALYMLAPLFKKSFYSDKYDIEKFNFQIRKLRRDLEAAQEKVFTLTNQLSTNVSSFYVFYL